MTNKVSTGEQQAIKDEIVAEVEASKETPTPAAGVSTETIRRLARNEARPIAKTAARDEVADHEVHCREPGGPLCNVEQKVGKLDEKLDQMRAMFNRGLGIVALAVFVAPIGAAYWFNRQSNSRADAAMKETINAAAEVARQLKAIQDAAKAGGAQLVPDPQPFHDTRVAQILTSSKGVRKP